jgi:autotransporter strand-loop-strand O-heptosyltransferase
MYTNLIRNTNIIRKRKPVINVNYIKGPFVEISNSPGDEFEVSFIDKKTEKLYHKGTITENHWIRANKSYFIDWSISINKNKGEDIYNIDLDLKDKRVFICFDSSSLGDSLAWVPYVDEFRKKHNCHVICSTFWNNLFEKEYPEIEFISRGISANNIIAQYNIGWYYENGEINYNSNPTNFRLRSLQQTASDILGLEHKEIKPRITMDNSIKKENIVSIAIHGTAQSKYWNNKEGWQQVVDYLKSKGYRVILISKEEDGYMGNKHPDGIEKHPNGSIEEVIKVIQKSKLFIGIGSGLSWLSWSTGTPTCIISGFSYPYTETLQNTIRIETPKGKCSGCFNDFRLDAGDWNWCPVNKGTDRQFECSKSITGEMVIEKIRNIIH